MTTNEKNFVEEQLNNPNNKFSKEALEDILKIFEKSPNICRKIVAIYEANGCRKRALEIDVNPWYKEMTALGISYSETKVLQKFINYMNEKKREEQIEFCRQNPIYTYELQERLGVTFKE